MVAGEGSADNDDVAGVADGAVGDVVDEGGYLETETGEEVVEGEEDDFVD